MNYAPKFWKDLKSISSSMRTARRAKTDLAKCSQQGEEQFPGVR